MLVSEVFPELSRELNDLLTERGEKELASTVPNLNLVERRRCGDDFCSPLYTRPKPSGSYGQNHRSFDLDAVTGMIILDVVDSEIVCVEIPYRDDVRKKPLEILP